MVGYGVRSEKVAGEGRAGVVLPEAPRGVLKAVARFALKGVRALLPASLPKGCAKIALCRFSLSMIYGARAILKQIFMQGCTQIPSLVQQSLSTLIVEGLTA